MARPCAVRESARGRGHVTRRPPPRSRVNLPCAPPAVAEGDPLRPPYGLGRGRQARNGGGGGEPTRPNGSIRARQGPRRGGASRARFTCAGPCAAGFPHNARARRSVGASEGAAGLAGAAPPGPRDDEGLAARGGGGGACAGNWVAWPKRRRGGERSWRSPCAAVGARAAENVAAAGPAACSCHRPPGMNDRRVRPRSELLAAPMRRHGAADGQTAALAAGCGDEDSEELNFTQNVEYLMRPSRTVGC